MGTQGGHAAMLHAGTRGYLIDGAAQRRLREAYFIAIVTPSIKHLRKELHDIERGRGRMRSWKTAVSGRSGVKALEGAQRPRA